LQLKDIGRLQSGYLADLQAYATADYRDILYYQGKMKPTMIWKKGSII
jgi:imidazolonepropionase